MIAGGKPQTVPLPGQVWGLAAPGPAGPLVATTYDGGTLSDTVLTALDRSGTVLWQHRAEGHLSPPRVSVDGTVWIARRGPDGYGLTGLDPGGSVLRSVVLDHEPHEHLSAFVLLADGFCAAWTPAERFHVVAPGRTPRVYRHDGAGRAVWSTTVELEAERPRPRTITASHRQPLLVSADRVAAAYEDGGSGIGVTFFLDTATGELVSRTRPGPAGFNAIAGPGEFLIGEQGYGIRRTTRYDRAGKPVRQWTSHGLLLVDRGRRHPRPRTRKRRVLALAVPRLRGGRHAGRRTGAFRLPHHVSGAGRQRHRGVLA
ncbi:hypothetical protein ACIRSS_34800 [Amycolatopsis sp. NPDC101161]|uniref:hypothetical protein n=1 Tax=Amycolatopsis sp. NPDC101161 TaxID=3363940 RepID=UPI003820BF39